MIMTPTMAGLFAGIAALLACWSVAQRVVPSRRLTIEPPSSPPDDVGDDHLGTDVMSRLGRRPLHRSRQPDRGAPGIDRRAPITLRGTRSRPRSGSRGTWRPRRPGRSAEPASRPLVHAAPPRRRDRAEPIEQSLADWCSATARHVRAGLSLAEAIGASCDDMPALSHVFAPVMSAQRRGASLATALDAATTSNDSVLLVVAVTRTCARLGGGAAQPLDRAAAVMHARLAAHEERRVHSAQAQLSATVLTVIPVAVLTLLLIVDPSVRSAFGVLATWFCLLIGLVLNAAGWAWMRHVIRDNGRRRWRPWSRGPTPAQRALPDGIELLVCCLHAGLTPPQVLDAVIDDVPTALRPAFDAVHHRVRRGHRFADALSELPALIGHDAYSLADSIASADRYGLPLAPVLERLSSEAAAARRRHDEIAARKLPVRLSFPLVATVLPAFVLIALAPAVIGAVSTLSLP